MNYRNDSHNTPNFHRIFFAAFMFMAAYLTTITVNAQTVVNAPVSTVTSGDAISLSSGERTVITGTIVDADENWVIINTAGKDMKVVLNDVDLNAEADEVFEIGMQVSVTGDMKGDDFGVPLINAKSITATEAGLVTVTP